MELTETDRRVLSGLLEDVKKTAQSHDSMPAAMRSSESSKAVRQRQGTQIRTLRMVLDVR